MLEINRPTAPSRRSVVRSAAWAVPAISIAAASPAFACSGTAVLAITSVTADWGANYYDVGTAQSRAPLTYTLTLTNSGAATTGAVNVVLQLPNGASDVFYHDSFQSAPANGWGGSTSDVNGWGSRHDTLTLSLAAGVPACGTSSTTVTVIIRDPNTVGGNQRQQSIAHTAYGSSTAGGNASLAVSYV